MKRCQTFIDGGWCGTRNDATVSSAEPVAGDERARSCQVAHPFVMR